MGVNGFSLTVVKKYLRGHGVRSAAFFAEDGQLRADGFGKAEIRYLNSAVLEQDVLKFKIPMNNVLLIKVIHPLHNLPKVVNLFINPNLPHLLPQIPITKLQRDITMFLLVPKLIQSNNVR